MADAQFTTQERWLFIVRALASVVILGVCFFVILTNSYPDATMKWAFGLVGLVVGYWLR